jgi:hypothetical protein
MAAVLGLYDRIGAPLTMAPGRSRPFDSSTRGRSIRLSLGRRRKPFDGRFVEGRVCMLRQPGKRLFHAEDALHHADADPPHPSGLHLADPLGGESADTILDLTIHSGPTERLSLGARSGKPCLHSLLNNRPLEFGENDQHSEHRLA